MADGFGANDLNQRLMRERIVFLGTEVDQDSANRICAELLCSKPRTRQGHQPLHQLARRHRLH
jgi:ATP-dependent protease ClpP protease subunit